ncbi:MAG: hypothetical protein KBD53_12405 [Candidatus Omnitrophica bacterium]|nr:hypothetical protein [Candidatus Omnitrophota bacterium]
MELNLLNGKFIVKVYRGPEMNKNFTRSFIAEAIYLEYDLTPNGIKMKSEAMIGYPRKSKRRGPGMFFIPAVGVISVTDFETGKNLLIPEPTILKTKQRILSFFKSGWNCFNSAADTSS